MESPSSQSSLTWKQISFWRGSGLQSFSLDKRNDRLPFSKQKRLKYNLNVFQGRAVFTQREFARGDLVVEYVGNLMDNNQAKFVHFLKPNKFELLFKKYLKYIFEVLELHRQCHKMFLYEGFM